MSLFIKICFGCILAFSLIVLSNDFSFHENRVNWPITSDQTFFSSDVPEFKVPPADYKLKQNYSKLDPHKDISPKVLVTALKFYEYNFDKILNTNFITIVDFNLNADERRMFLVNMKTGHVRKMLTSVGSGSDPDNDGIANYFSNIPDSFMSSLGFYLTGEEYVGENGPSLRLHGLSETNSNAFSRFIVVHGASYVSEQLNWAGRSQGCPAVSLEKIKEVILKIKDGSLLYISHGE
jgi:hypothetical protein